MQNIINKTPFEASLSLLSNLRGEDCVGYFFSAAFALENQRWYVSDKQIKSPLTDQYWDDENPGSVRYPGQLSHNKPGTDIIVNAQAVAPGEKPVAALQTGVQVGQMRSSVVVFGDRVWQNGQISQPSAFTTFPIRWEYAFGGQSQSDANPAINEHNPLGIGWTHPDHPLTDGTRLPNIERPDQLIRNPRDNPAPAGYGSLGAESPLRNCYAGTYDDHWKKTRCPFAPDDFDPAFFYTATPELRSTGFLAGTEPVRLIHLSSVSDLVFQLPGGRPTGSVVVGSRELELAFNLETVVIETEREETGRLEVLMFWRATTPAPRSVADVKDIKLSLARS